MPNTLIPAIAAICMSVYWAAVVIKLFLLAKKLRKQPNAIPRETVGILMRILWYPNILLLLLSLCAAAIPKFRAALLPITGTWLLPLTQPTLLWQIAAAFALAAALLCIVFTFICWRKMGRSWRIGIDPHEKLDLVSTGPYRFVRHPIYSLRTVINFSIMLAVPVPLVILTAAIDSLLLQIEARREESYMEKTHGQTYLGYKKNVGRFVPRFRVV